MELRLDPEIPVTRVVNGHNVFNKGYHHGLRGKTYEEYYGKERAVEIRKRHSEALKGHRYWSNGNAHAFACIAITPEGKWYRFESITQAAQKLNLNYATVRRYIKRKIKPQNGWQWSSTSKYSLICGDFSPVHSKTSATSSSRSRWRLLLLSDIDSLIEAKMNYNKNRMD